MLTSFEAGESITPLAVVGPYGSGKTQFLYEIYRKSWQQGIPAVYTDLKTILEGYKEADDDISATEWIEEEIDEQVSKFNANGNADWVPHFRTEANREEFIDEFLPEDSIDTNKRVLLIDEVEQKYTKFDEYFDTDDKNPLREVLDGLSDVFQAWSFGLVSAYEILGEADLRRFQEARIPISDLVNVEQQLKHANRPPALANGVWWAARGRYGWISKCIDKYPKDGDYPGDTFETWLSEVADYTYYGADAVNRVWRDIPGGDTAAAKQTIMFAEPGYDPWVIDGPNAISVERAHSEIIDGIRDITDMNADVHDIISTNLKDILRALSPPDNRVSDEEGSTIAYLPKNAFTRDSQMEGLLDLVTDFISSFEKRDDQRSEATGLLNDIETESLTDQWMSIMGGDGIKTDPDINPWTVDPSVVQRAFPPLALNPEVLTDKKSATLREELEKPIDIDSEVGIRGGTIDIKLCPTTTAFQTAQEDLSDLGDVTKTTLLIKPENEDSKSDGWETENYIDRLEGLELVHIASGGSDRIWDFVLQLNEYLTNIDAFDEVISKEIVEDKAITNEPRDEVRNTIKALFSELRRITRNEAQRASEQYETAYSLEAAGGLIWNDDELSGRAPFYGSTGSAKVPLLGLAFGVVFSVKSIEDIEYSKTLQPIMDARGAGYLSGGQFGYKYLIDQVFDLHAGRLDPDVLEQRRKYGTAQGSLVDPMGRLKRALGYLSVLNDETAPSLYDKLTDTDVAVDDIAVLRQSQITKRQAKGLCWGLLLSWCLENDPSKHKTALDNTQRDLKQLIGRIEDIDTSLSLINKQLKPPATVEIDETISVETDRIDSYLENADAVSEGFELLIDETKRDSDLLISTALIRDIVETYSNQFGETVGDVEDTLDQINLTRNTKELQSEYRQLRKWVHNDNVITTVEGVEKETLVEQVNELGELIFDHVRAINTETVPLADIERLTDLEDGVKADLTKIESVTTRTEKITERQQEIENKTDTVENNLLLFDDELRDAEGGL